MTKIRRTILGIVSGIYLVLFLLKVDIPPEISLLLLLILLANLGMEEWIKYKDTKRNIHLLVPISALILFVYAIGNLIFM